MDLRNRIGLYGAYFLGLSGIRFTLPYLPLYLRQEGMSDRTIGTVIIFSRATGLRVMKSLGWPPLMRSANL
jgi:hypothetical protein